MYAFNSAAIFYPGHPYIESTTVLSDTGISLCSYLCLVKPSDGEEYSAKMFTEAYINKFQFVIVTQLVHPPAELLQQCYVIRIHVSDR